MITVVQSRGVNPDCRAIPCVLFRLAVFCFVFVGSVLLLCSGTNNRNKNRGYIGGLQRLSISLFCYKFANKVHVVVCVAETLLKLGYSTDEDLKDGSLFHKPCYVFLV